MKFFHWAHIFGRVWRFLFLVSTMFDCIDVSNVRMIIHVPIVHQTKFKQKKAFLSNISASDSMTNRSVLHGLGTISKSVVMERGRVFIEKIKSSVEKMKKWRNIGLFSRTLHRRSFGCVIEVWSFVNARWWFNVLHSFLLDCRRSQRILSF